AHAGPGDALWRKFQDTREDQWATRARDEIDEALRLDPQDVSVRYALVVLYRGRGRMAEAIEELRRIVDELRKAIDLRPNYWGHHYGLGQAHYAAGRYPEAMAAFRRVTELQPDNAW